MPPAYGDGTAYSPAGGKSGRLSAVPSRVSELGLLDTDFVITTAVAVQLKINPQGA